VKDSPYEAGRRSPEWVKIRFSLQQEFVIGGYTEPRGSRSGFGALLIGYYEGKRLVYASKVGTGFTAKTLAAVFQRLQSRERKESPFFAHEYERNRWTRGPLARVHWVEPELVAQIGFTEWTGEGSVRHPVFLGLREDKAARKVVREPVAG
jgi:bifunctional non-homologous end joining protein LigD